MTLEDVAELARRGSAAGCKEALFTLGDKPEQRYATARHELELLGHATTASYLMAAARVALDAGLLPHINAGILTEGEISALRHVSVSQGLMLESVSDRLCRRGGPHFGSPDKRPAIRLTMIEAAGRLNVPFTTGILIGIGETRSERIDSLLAIRDLDDRYGHIQEIIIQNFAAKPGTKMAAAAEPSMAEHQWTIAVARLLFRSDMNVQAPPNLRPDGFPSLIAAGINDWGGISAVTPDHVNPEAPWPHLAELESSTRAAGARLTERLAIYPAYAKDPSHWLAAPMLRPTLALLDGSGFARSERWAPGAPIDPPLFDTALIAGARANTFAVRSDMGRLLAKASAGVALTEREIARLFDARDEDFQAVCRAADELRSAVNGNAVSYVVTRNINYTNICTYKCRFCAFSKGKMNEDLRGRPYNLSLEEIAARAGDAQRRGATEVCLQGGIHPEYTGTTYLNICQAIKAVVPDIHVHAFSPLEVTHGAQTLGLPIRDFLSELKRVGLASLPGTAAEILDDEVRAVICPDKIDTEQWLRVMRVVHELGLRSTATIMFGHVDRYEHWARHLLAIRNLQLDTGGFTEFVPLPFVHMESPLFLKGNSRRGPTFRETILMHAVARLSLNGAVGNIQASWVKLGRVGVTYCLEAGANDLGGTLMDETISRSAGAAFGSEMTPCAMEQLIRDAKREPRRRTTLYADVTDPWHQRSQRGDVRISASVKNI